MNATASRGIVVAGAALLIPVALIGLLLTLLGAGGHSTQCANPNAIAPSAAALANIPDNYLRLYQQAARKYRLGPNGWSILAGVGSIETNHGRLPAPGVTSGQNSHGCCAGPMQFHNGFGSNASNTTWGTYGLDGNRDGRKNIYDPRDAIPSAANYLRASGAPRDWYKALFAYNRADWYVTDVLARAERYRASANEAGGLVNVSTSRAAPGGPQKTASPPLSPMGPRTAARKDHLARAIGNWQSDNAVDIEVPRGTAVLAVDDGTITLISGKPLDPSRPGVFNGKGVTLRTRSNTYWYGHLTDASVRVGQRVRAGQQIGTSGYANGVDHLHIGRQTGSPDDVWPTDGTGGAAAQPGVDPSCLPVNAQIPSGPLDLQQTERVSSPREFTMLPAWVMAGGRAPQEVDARILPGLLAIARAYDARITAAREPGHASHGDGTGLDIIPNKPGGAQAWAKIERLARDIGWTPACGASGVAPACPLKDWVRFVGYNGYARHGDPAHAGADAHLHISWRGSGPATGALVAPHSSVYTFPAPNETDSEEV